MQSMQEYFALVKAKLGEIYDRVFRSFISSLFRKPVSILFLGIDNAGKTTLTNKLRGDTTDQRMPTRHPSTSQIEIGSMSVRVVDIGGHYAARLGWKDYFYNCDAIVFIVDVNDIERFPEVKETYEMVRSFEKKAPISVLMNKVDLVGRTPETAESDNLWTEWLSEETGIINEDPEDRQPVRISYVCLKGGGQSDSITGSLAQSFKWLETRVLNQGKKTAV